MFQFINILFSYAAGLAVGVWKEIPDQEGAVEYTPAVSFYFFNLDFFLLIEFIFFNKNLFFVFFFFSLLSLIVPI